MKKARTKHILSLDGGGIRGIIPLTALVKLEKETGKLTRETFDFVAGTSTGASIAGAVAAGIPATQILESYILMSRSIFKKNILTPFKRFFKGYMYSTTKLNELLLDSLGNEAAFWTLNDSPIDILITAKRVRDSKQWYFVKDKDVNTCRTGILPLVDCMTASTAAPTFFETWTIPEVVGTDVEPVGTLVDGGTGVAGNPVYQACIEAFYYTKNYKPESTTVVSLGTGKFTGVKNPANFLSWVQWLISELIGSPGEQQTELVHRHFPKTRFFRLDPDLKLLVPGLEKKISLDDISQIETVIDVAKKFAAQIDWKKILNGEDQKFKIDKHNTKWSQYKWPK